MNIHDFDEIRPFLPEELPATFDSLLADKQFCDIMQSFFKDTPLEILKKKIYACQTSLEVQKTFFYPLMFQLLDKCSNGATLDTTVIPEKDRNGSFTFVSNHRDIVLDAALLDVLLIQNGYRTTVEIAIGDNLLIHPWIKTLVRINKSFIVQRSLSIRELMASSKRMSQYMHFAISEKHESIWIAQREGRAKDSNDRTQESVLKMMAMGGEGSPAESLKALNIVPLTISYEYDPCDYLKAKEFQQKRDNPEFKKSRQDDLANMQTGIFGFKGRVEYRLAEPANRWIDTYAHLPKPAFFAAVAQHMDKAIHTGYTLYPGNYVALDLLQGTQHHTAHYTEEEKAKFEAYIESRLALIDLPQKDEPFLRRCMLTMYANPVINHLKAVQGCSMN